jgi:hypothetical protein
MKDVLLTDTEENMPNRYAGAAASTSSYLSCQVPAYEDLYRNPPAVFLILIMTTKFTPRLTADRLRDVGLDELLDDWHLQ